MGGIRLEGQDRMRVTLKVCLNENDILQFRINLDLYYNTQLEKFIRKITEQLEVGRRVTAGTLANLMLCSENYRLKKKKVHYHENMQHAKPLTEKEKISAI
jgi:hypothetical protein